MVPSANRKEIQSQVTVCLQVSSALSMCGCSTYFPVISQHFVEKKIP